MVSALPSAPNFPRSTVPAASTAAGDAIFSAGASNYRYGTYIAANCFYNITSYLQVGLEYIYGRRNTYFMGNATDSRIQTQLALTF